MSDRNEVSKPAPVRPDRMELRLALQRLASGYYNRPDVLQEVARRILKLDGENLA